MKSMRTIYRKKRTEALKEAIQLLLDLFYVEKRMLEKIPYPKIKALVNELKSWKKIAKMGEKEL